MTLTVGLVQLCSGDRPDQNLATTQDLIAQAAGQGATLITTPEVTNCVSTSRTQQAAVLSRQEDDPTLAALRARAAELGVWLLIGSLALLGADDDRFVNRCFLIAPDGRITASYDKIHMFDVTVSEQETYRESDGYRPGSQAVTAPAGDVTLGLSICYDVRFAYLYRTLAKSGAQLLMIPAAFSPVTGAAHWKTLLRARAIETGSWVIAPAQTGQHDIIRGRPRATYGHSMVVDPWGEVVLDAGTEVGAFAVQVDPDRVEQARRRIPALTHDRQYQVSTHGNG